MARARRPRPPTPALLLAGCLLRAMAPPLAAASLPVSILNEADVAVENGRRHLEAAQLPSGLWPAPDGRESSLPALAFLDVPADDGDAPHAVLARAASAALARLATSVPRPTDADTHPLLEEDALVVSAALALHGEAVWGRTSPEERTPRLPASAILRAAAERLRLRRPAGAEPATDWLGRVALELLPAPPARPADWSPIGLPAPSPSGPAPRDVAIAGYSRLRAGGPAAAPDAILAHLRWLRNRLAAPASTPEDLHYAALFFDLAPEPLVASAGIPPRWRTALAQRLLATARSDGRDGAFWTAPGADPLRQTLYAVATLSALSR